MQRLWLNTLKPLLITSTVVIGGGFSYLYYITSRNYKRFQLEQEESSIYKDTTRDQNLYFGINWGFKADYMIQEQIDSGDVLYFKFDCRQCLSVGDFLKCSYMHMQNSDQDHDALGIAYRDKSGVNIIFPQYGKLQVLSYNDVVCQPFLKNISLRKLQVTQPE